MLFGRWVLLRRVGGRLIQGCNLWIDLDLAARHVRRHPCLLLPGRVVIIIVAIARG